MVKKIALFFCLFSLNFFLFGCLKTRLNIKEINNPQKKHLKEMADIRSNWYEMQESLRKINGRIEDLEQKIEEKEKKQLQNKTEEALALELIQEQLKAHVEALKKIKKDLTKVKKRVYKKRKKREKGKRKGKGKIKKTKTPQR